MAGGGLPSVRCRGTREQSEELPALACRESWQKDWETLCDFS